MSDRDHSRGCLDWKRDRMSDHKHEFARVNIRSSSGSDPTWFVSPVQKSCSLVAESCRDLFQSAFEFDIFSWGISRDIRFAYPIRPSSSYQWCHWFRMCYLSRFLQWQVDAVWIYTRMPPPLILREDPRTRQASSHLQRYLSRIRCEVYRVSVRHIRKRLLWRLQVRMEYLMMKFVVEWRYTAKPQGKPEGTSLSAIGFYSLSQLRGFQRHSGAKITQCRIKGVCQSLRFSYWASGLTHTVTIYILASIDSNTKLNAAPAILPY